MSNFKKGQAIKANGTKASPEKRPGTFVAVHPTTKGDFIEVQLDGVEGTNKFRASQVQAA